MTWGFGYVTDEVVAIDVEDLAVTPYPKAIELGTDSLALLDLDHLEDANSRKGAKTTVPANLLGSISAGGHPALLVRLTGPAADADEPSSEPSSPVTSLIEGFAMVFAGSASEPRSLDTLAALLDATPTLTLPRTTIDDACARIDAALRVQLPLAVASGSAGTHGRPG